MNPLGTRARAEELASLLDGAVSGPGTLTAPYATLATRLRALVPVLEDQLTPRAEFRTALRQRLVAVATVQAANAPAAYAEPIARPKALDAAVSWTQGRKAQRRIGALAGGMAAVIGFTGVAVAATRSLPGQPFYGLKRAGEGVQLDVTGGDTAKGSKHLEFAATRLREVKALAHGDGELSLGAGHPSAGGLAFGGSVTKRIADTLADFNKETASGTSLLTKVYRRTGKAAPLRIITTFTTAQSSQLTALLPSLPTGVKDEAQQSLTLVTQAGSDATDLLALGTCGGSCYPGNGGPTLPTQPVPAPGVTASPSDSADPGNNGVPACGCGGTPSVAPTPTDSPTQATAPTGPPDPTQPTTPPSTDPTTGPTPTPTPTGPVLVIPPIVPLPTFLPTSVPLPIPTLPVPLPTLPLLPSVLPTLLPGLLPKG